MLRSSNGWNTHFSKYKNDRYILIEMGFYGLLELPLYNLLWIRYTPRNIQIVLLSINFYANQTKDPYLDEIVRKLPSIEWFKKDQINNCPFQCSMINIVELVIYSFYFIFLSLCIFYEFSIYKSYESKKLVRYFWWKY